MGEPAGSPDKAPIRGLSEEVRRQATLHGAWKHVRSKGLQSPSRRIREETKRFEERSFSYIRSIERKLRYGRFKFEPAIGVPIRRPGKGVRPVVAAPVRSRIVQRAILDVLSSQPSIKQILQAETSFGGLPGKGVKDAFKYLQHSISDGYSWFLTTDIQNFFTAVPRLQAIEALLYEIDDPPFRDLLGKATEVDLENATRLEGVLDEFPTWELGVGQGFCLSPLLGNALLYDFDQQMNKRGIVCLRYIDDIILLAKKRSHLTSAFQSAVQTVDHFGMSLYDPQKNSHKAALGRVSAGISYLGCHYSEGALRPSRESQQNLLERVHSELTAALHEQADLSKIRSKKSSVQEVLGFIDFIVRGWGNQYSFCNCPNVMNRLDDRISDYIQAFFSKSGLHFPDLGPVDSRRLLGVQVLADCKQDPIFGKGWQQAA